ncbi:cullin-3a-related [Anaeramoeba flamelloides]|uniref:Cullin-3a-related n=1 Tax=Anaeramoeba flamelloides TaxID=1746091 RepID=A0ABQ8XG94_9EUKA|nr:cullin-3a-related [Anaeramoeba flamelloides]
MDSELEKILRMVHNIYDDQTSKIIFYELYSSIYSHVTNNKEKILYERICQIIEQKTKQHATFLTFLQEETILETFNEKWKHHLSKMKILSKVFTFLENHYLVPNQKLILFQVGTKFWKQYIFESESAQESKVLSKLTQSLMDNISKSRIGDTIDQTLMKNVISMYIEISEGLDFYQMWFETIFLQTSKNYFRITSQELLSTNQCGSYLIKVIFFFQLISFFFSLCPYTQSNIQSNIQLTNQPNNQSTNQSINQPFTRPSLKIDYYDDEQNSIVKKKKINKNRINFFFSKKWLGRLTRLGKL